MSADFTPNMGSYHRTGNFRYWVQKVLPLVYDDSLSYYELLAKVVDYLNKTMEDVNQVIEDTEKLHDAYVQLQDWTNNFADDLTAQWLQYKTNLTADWETFQNQVRAEWIEYKTQVNQAIDEFEDYVRNYLANLDVQEEINNKLDAMAEDGSLTALIRPFLENAVAEQNQKIAVLEGRMDALAADPVANGSLTEIKFSDTLKLKTIKDYVTPQMFGAKNDGVTDDSLAIANAIQNADCIFVPSGTYFIGTNINLSSLNGKKVLGVPGKSRFLFDDSAINVSSDGYNYMFSLTECSDFEIGNITFEYAPSGSNTYNNVLVNVDCSQRIAFSNCDFYSDKDNSGSHHICTCVWVRKTATLVGDNSEISFDGCIFINHTGASAGGSLWVSSPVDNVVMNKCYVSHCTNDEAVVAWQTNNGTLNITDSYLEIVKLNIESSQLIGAWVGGVVSVKGCNLVSGPGNGANSFIRAHEYGTIMVADSFIKVDACFNTFVFKTQAQRSSILLSNCTVEAISSTITESQRLYEGMGTEGVFKASNCLFKLGKNAADTTKVFYVMAAGGGTISLTGCSFETVNPENFKELTFYFSAATGTIMWTAVGNSFIGSGAIGMAGLSNLSIAAGGNNRNTSGYTFNSTAESAFA